MEKTILLHDEPYTIGRDIAISIGINTQCKKIITKSIIYSKDDSFYCKNEGILIKLYHEDLKDFYCNTPKNIKLLKNQIQIEN